MSNFALGQNDNRYVYDYLELPKENGIVTYQEVVSAEGVSADDLFNSARLWFLENFKYSKEVIQYENKETGIISGNASTTIRINYNVAMMGDMPVENKLTMTISIDVKEGKFRYKIFDIFLGGGAPNESKRPVGEFFSPEWMYNKKGKPKEHMFDWYDAYINEIHSIENSIQAFLKGNQFRKSKDW